MLPGGSSTSSINFPCCFSQSGSRFCPLFPSILSALKILPSYWPTTFLLTMRAIHLHSAQKDYSTAPHWPGHHYVDQADLILRESCLPLCPKCWDQRRVLICMHRTCVAIYGGARQTVSSLEKRVTGRIDMFVKHV